jgi:2-dehydro-3-deoxyphosphogluconate aldolase/(4S)-4-hydroxy-2-oxoglutarate aldolase
MTVEETSRIHHRIGSLGVVPVVAVENPDSALALADALIEGGLPIAEITFRTTAAAATIQKIAAARPEILLGAGTILNTEDLQRAVECGAAFGVAPGLNPKVVREAVNLGFPFSPGIMTPSDIEAALTFGVKVLKFFPAGAAGGVTMLRSISAPYAHLGIKFIPTGGISQDNMKTYLEQKNVLAIGGTWIATREDIGAGRWNVIRDNCRAAMTVAERLRTAAPAAH